MKKNMNNNITPQKLQNDISLTFIFAMLYSFSWLLLYAALTKALMH